MNDGSTHQETPVEDMSLDPVTSNEGASTSRASPLPKPAQDVFTLTSKAVTAGLDANKVGTCLAQFSDCVRMT